jgi:LacI family transcriptional regulator
VLLPDLYGEFFSEVIRGIDQVVQRRAGTCWCRARTTSGGDRGGAAGDAGPGGRAAGDVAGPGCAHLARTCRKQLPVVLLNCEVDGRTYDSSTSTITAVPVGDEHLLDLGHRRIGLITGPLRNHDARERLRGSHGALEAAGVEPAGTGGGGAISRSVGLRAALRLLELEPRPTAMIAANDSMAIGALSALREAGVRVPEDVAVVGFDDIPIARYVTPPLTTVRVSIPELGGGDAASVRGDGVGSTDRSGCRSCCRRSWWCGVRVAPPRAAAGG